MTNHTQTLSAVVAAVALALGAGAAHADDAQDIIDTMHEKDVARWGDINAYSVEQAVMGAGVTSYYQRYKIKGDDGSTWEAFVGVPEGDFDCGASAPVEMTEAAMNAQLFAGDEPGNSPASMARAVRDDAKLLGEEAIHGKQTWRLQARDVDVNNAAAGQEVEIRTLDFWVDRSNYVPVQIVMDGTVSEQGKARDIKATIVFSDYREVDGSKLLVPFTSDMNIQGAFTEEEQAEIEMAKQQLEEMEAQMAAMPAAQRQMMEQMLGEQLQMIRQIAAGEGVQVQMATEAVTLGCGK